MSKVQPELEKSRKDLLDLSLRNTLLNYRRLKTKGVEIVDEVPRQVYQILVGEERRMSFLPAPQELLGPEERQVQGDLLTEWLDTQDYSQESDDISDRHRDTKLQTPYAPARLERRLLNSYYAARSTIEEQGVNTLYLALGMLQWFESPSSDRSRNAPLILIPVSLQRTSVRAKFRLVYTGEELGSNLSLAAKLRAEFGIELPTLPASEDLDPESYFEQVSTAIRGQHRWQVLERAMHLGFFWFTKLLMYEDLDPNRWTTESTLDEHPVLSALLGEGFTTDPSPFPERDLDERVNLRDLHHIRDADSSQTLALLDVHAGRNLVIQGPPGTGKSQTISNLIAESVARGKRVLFVAEKMAALDVVKRRLDEDGVGDACLELHSHRTNKRTVLEELRRTLHLGKPHIVTSGNLEALTAHRDRLNAYVSAIHTSIGKSGVTPYKAYGEALAAKQRLGETPRPLLNKKSGWETWEKPELEARCQQLRNLELLLQTIGVPREHRFWSSRRKTFLPKDRDRLLQLCEGLQRQVQGTYQSLEALAKLLDLQAPESPVEGGKLLAAAERVLRLPKIEGMAVQDSRWFRAQDQLTALVADGVRYQALHHDLAPKLLPEAWERDMLALRSALVQFGDRWWRFLAPNFHRALRELRALSRERLPRALDERLYLVDSIRESQQLEQRLDEHDELLGALFGPHWEGPGSDWDHLSEALEWLRSVHRDVEASVLPEDFLSCLDVQTPLNREHLTAKKQEAQGQMERLETELNAIESFLEIDRDVQWLRSSGELVASFADLEGRMALWLEDPDSLHDIVRFNHLDTMLRELGLQEIVEASTDWEAASVHLVDLLSFEWYNTLIERALTEREELTRFEGRSHHQVLECFQDLDRKRIESNRARVALAHWEQLPPPNAGGQLGILRHQMELKRRHLPIRQLVERAGAAIQKIKPVFMMSPLSVASYIPPGAVEFDLVVFDEASQIQPVDAFGALLRGRQAVVVGDRKQLPPTPFFEKLVDDAEAEEEERSTTGDLESILGLFNSKGAPDRMLRWHYRSQHDSLIAVSNHEFYEDKLFVFPSPDLSKAELGVVLHYHPETTYEPGSKRQNIREAEIVADAVVAHARKWPHLSLGVAAFSSAQAQAVNDQMEVRRRRSPDLEDFFDTERHEPFFVKNLENVQGDERDHIFISVGYGKQESGVLWLKFGPLNQEGGERRLNVLITRARKRCEIFSNFKADEIDLTKTSAEGVRAFKRYLQFAEHGRLDLPEPSDRPPDSIFEELVGEAIRGLGYEVHFQVGSGGFFIDLAVLDSEHKGSYLLGVECDGRTYHSAKWARDRDRLRQQVLEGLGWTLHRVWSTDWFRNPKRELRRIAECLEAAKAARGAQVSNEKLPKSPEPNAVDQDEAAPGNEPFRRESFSNTERHLTAKPYRTADVSAIRGALKGQELHTRSPAWLARWVTTVVKVESPVHESEIARRIVHGAGLQRVGGRLQDAVRRAIDHAVRQGEIRKQKQFLWASTVEDCTVRERRDLKPRIKMHLIAPEEIEAAVLAVVEAATGIQEDEATIEIARLFGFDRTTASIAKPIQRAISRLKEQGALRATGTEVWIAN